MKPFPENMAYMVSAKGRIYSKKTGKFLRPQKNIKGYLRVACYDGGVRVWYFIHRVVAATFKKNPHNKKQVNHLNFDITDNRNKNLRYATASENIKYNRHRHKFISKKKLNGKPYKYVPDPACGF